MSSTSAPAITNNTRAGGFDASWASLYSLMDFPQYYPELVERYGKAFEVLEFLRFAGQTGTCAGYSKTLFEKGAPERYVTLHSEIATAAAGAAITVEIEEWNTVAQNGKSAVAIGDKIGIEGKYCTVSGVKCADIQWYQVTAIATTTANPNEEDTDITATPLNALTLLAVAVPAATKLMVTGGNFAPGSAGAKSKVSGWYSRTFNTGIKRARFDIEGSQVSNERYTHHLKNGGMGMVSEASVEAEFRLDHALNYDIILGDTADNLTMVNRDSIANTVRSTKGILPHLNASGMKQYFTSSYTVADIDNIKDLFISQGVVDSYAAFFMGSGLMKGIENNALDFVKEYSGGTDFLSNLKDLNVGFKTIKKNGITLSLHELKSFSNPNTLGNYGYKNRGFIIPQTQVTVRDSEMSADVKMPNLKLEFKAFGSENRERIVGTIAGVNGIDGFGNNFVDSFDSVAMEWLSEAMLLYFKVNQSISVAPDTIL